MKKYFLLTNRLPAGYWRRIVSFSLALFWPMASWAQELPGAHMSVTRVIYPETSRQGVAAVFINNSQTDYLIQSYVSQASEQTGLPMGKDGGFLITPPLARVSASENSTLRVLRIGGQLPKDRESVFYLTVRLLPPSDTTEADKPTARVAMVRALAVKIFYRPSGLPRTGAGPAAKMLTATAGREGITLHNPSPFWLTLRTMTVSGAPVPVESLFRMIPPFGQLRWAWPAGKQQAQGALTVAWRGINDAGYDTDEISTTAAFDNTP